MVPRVLIIDIRAIASKTTTTTKFEIEKFDEKSNFVLWKMQVTSLLVKEGTHKTLLGVFHYVCKGGKLTKKSLRS